MVPKVVYTATDGAVNLGRPTGTFVTDVNISTPKAFMTHVADNVPPMARPAGTLPRVITEIRVSPGSVLPDPTVPFTPGTPTGWLPPKTPGTIGRVWIVTEDAAGLPVIKPGS